MIAISGVAYDCDYRNIGGMEPASTIISICGGFSAVAEMVGRNEISVRRWTYEKARGGTGGLIPSDAAQVILRAAVDRGLPLTPAHFFSAPQSQGDAA